MSQVIAALDIGGTKIASALVHLLDVPEADAAQTSSSSYVPTLTHRHTQPTCAQEGGAAVCARAVAAVQTLIADAKEAGVQLVGVGISSAGVVDPKTGDITYANELMPGWGGTHLASEITRASSLRCSVLNDVHAHALGEARRGAGSAYSSALVVAVGTGIGGAFVNHGAILLGAHNEAGHIGHVACPAASGVSCSCGASAHLEPVGSGPGIIAEYLRLGGKAHTFEKNLNDTSDKSDISAANDISDGGVLALDGKIINERALAGDIFAQQAQQRAGHALGEVLGSMCNMLDPACVILSGSVVLSGKYYHEALAESFKAQVMPPLQNLPIIGGSLGGDAPLIGAAENCLFSGYAEFQTA